MLSSIERHLAAFGPWQPAATLASALVGLGLVLGWPAQHPGAVSSAPAPLAAADRCTDGDEVSNFVCRNTWLAGLRRSYR
jgi:hypothetical protein